MSYILEALKKLERERQIGDLPRLDTRPLAQPVARHRARWWLWCAAGSIGLIAAGSGVWHLAVRQTLRVHQAHLTSSAPAPATPNAASHTPPNAPMSPALDAKAAQDGEHQAPPVAAEAARPSPAVKSTQVIPHPLHPETPVARKPPVAAPPAAGVRQHPPIELPVTPHIELSHTARPPAPTLPPAAEEVSPPPAPVAPLLEDLPAAVREAVEPLRISMLAYSANAQDRLVSINSRTYHEGERMVGGKLVVEAIARGGAILNYQGQRFLLRP